MKNVIKELKNKWLFVILQYYNITILQYELLHNFQCNIIIIYIYIYYNNINPII